MSVDCVDYFELKSVWVRGCRNGNIRKLNPFERGLFRACLTYMKIKGPIINKKVLDMLGRLIEVLTITPRREALKYGFEKAKSLIRNSLLIRISPKILNLVRSLEYISYLGFMEMNRLNYIRILCNKFYLNLKFRDYVMMASDDELPQITF
jgi:hypothetical protein